MGTYNASDTRVRSTLPRGVVATWIGLDWYYAVATWSRPRLLGCGDDCFATLDTGIRPGHLMQEDDQLGTTTRRVRVWATQTSDEDDALLLLTVLRRVDATFLIVL